MTPCETIYVSNLPGDVHYSEIKNCFEQFGRIDDIDIKRRSEITFAFVRYSTTREAARCAREGRINMGKIKCNVNFSRRDGGGIRGRQSSFGSHRKSKYCALITYLPHGTSWQDLKDFCRPEADVILSKVIKPDTGKVYFATNSDLRSVVNRLDRKRLRSHLNDTGTVRVRIASPSLSRSYSRSRSRSRSPERRRYRRDKTRSRTCSRSVSYSKSRSKSLSPDSEYSRSRSRSRNSK